MRRTCIRERECVDALGSEVVAMWSVSEYPDVENNGVVKSMQKHCA
jgi:hypothetical protein